MIVKIIVPKNSNDLNYEKKMYFFLSKLFFLFIILLEQ
jgi:hypothetical protein